jgi:hypothetical protein
LTSKFGVARLSPMLKRTRPLLLLVLFAGLAVLARELPECMALADDVSNDGNVPAFLQEKLVRKVSVSGVDSTEFPAFSLQQAGPVAREFPVEADPAFSARPGRLLLSLFHVQRK